MRPRGGGIMANKKKTVLVYGAPAYPYSNQGFGIVTGKLIDEWMKEKDWRIVHFARGLSLRGLSDQKEPPYMLLVPQPNDPHGYGGDLANCIVSERPDVAIVVADPVSFHDTFKVTELRQIPTLLYGPTEGGPILSPWKYSFQEIFLLPKGRGGRITTYTNFSAQVIRDCLQEEKRPVEVIHHGVDHQKFRQYAKPDRDEIRRRLGWSNKFVVSNVATNAGRKNLPLLMEAVSLARESIPELLLYLHTTPFQGFMLSGHNLYDIRDYFRLQGTLLFPEDIFGQQTFLDKFPYEGWGQGGGKCGLIDIYNALDLFVSTSGAEGWNLPLTEAAACGIPCCTPKYSGGWEVAESFACGIPVHDFTFHPSGFREARARPEDVAGAIVTLYKSESARREMSQRGLKATSKLDWHGPMSKLVSLAKELAG